VFLPTDDTERTLRRALEEFGSDLEVETESLELLVILTVRPGWLPRDRSPELRLTWLRGEGQVVASVHPLPSAGQLMRRIDIQKGDPRRVAEAGVKELRAVIPPASRE
jgi:hypothetical protein